MAKPVRKTQEDLRADVIIVGGGLVGALTALKIATAKPSLSVVLIEAEDRLAGQNTWFFHDSDFTDIVSLEWLKPVISREWSESSIQMPHLMRVRPGLCHAIRSEDLHRELKKRLGDNLLLESVATRLSESHVELQSGRIISGRCALDARGFANAPSKQGFFGYKKFLSLEVELEAEHGMSAPVEMDASCPQLDGFRYFEVLPWNERVVQVTETFYSDTPEINRERILSSIRSFINRKGWTIKAERREESGLVHLPLTSNYLTSNLGGEALPIGSRGGYYHTTRGSALADTIRFANFLASIEDLTTKNARDGLLKFRRPWASRQRFYRLLNRWMFYAAESSLRYGVLQAIYEQPNEVATRFSAGLTTWTDRLRILTHRPQLPFDRALRCFSERVIEAWGEARAQHIAATAPPAPQPPSVQQAS